MAAARSCDPARFDPDDQWLRQVRDRIHERSIVAPWLSAVRVGSDKVGYADLDIAIDRYSVVVAAQGLSECAGFTAALLARLPALGSSAQPEDRGQLVAEALGWLGRDIEVSHRRVGLAG